MLIKLLSYIPNTIWNFTRKNRIPNGNTIDRGIRPPFDEAGNNQAQEIITKYIKEDGGDPSITPDFMVGVEDPHSTRH